MTERPWKLLRPGATVDRRLAQLEDNVEHLSYMVGLLRGQVGLLQDRVAALERRAEGDSP